MRTEKFSLEQIIAALQAKRGMVYLAARALKCSAKTIYRMLQRHPEIQEAHDELRGQMVDVAESALHKLVVNGNVPATLFYLRTQARDRGYVERIPQPGINLNLTAADLAKLSDEELHAHIARLESAAGRT